MVVSTALLTSDIWRAFGGTSLAGSFRNILRLYAFSYFSAIFLKNMEKVRDISLTSSNRSDKINLIFYAATTVELNAKVE